MDDGNHRVPLRGRQVVTGGVVAAGVQHHHGSGGCGFQVCEHAGGVDAPRRSVVIGVGANLKTGGAENRAVVFPAGVGDQQFGGRIQAVQKICGDLEAAGATQGLDGGHAFGERRVAAEDQIFDGGVIRHDAVNRQIAARAGRIGSGFFGRAHTLQQRQLAGVVEIHAHTQIHLVGVGVGAELFVQAKNRVTGGHFDGGKERHAERS